MQKVSVIVIGLVVVVVGVLWTLQGLDVMGGSGMSGHGIWAVIGIILILVGLGTVGATVRSGSRGRAG
jgi:hypothetical protein